MWYRNAQEADAALLAALETARGELTRVSVLVNEPTGVLVLRSIDEKTDEITRLALLPEFRGRGLSAQLLGEAVSLARRRGKTRLRLRLPVEHPAAQSLFQTYGVTEGELSLAPTVMSY